MRKVRNVVYKSAVSHSRRKKKYSIFLRLPVSQSDVSFNKKWSTNSSLQTLLTLRMLSYKLRQSIVLIVFVYRYR